MSRRARVVGATALMLVGAFMVITSYIGGSELHAAGIDRTGLDIARYLVWGGAGTLLVSAFLFISASAQ